MTRKNLSAIVALIDVAIDEAEKVKKDAVERGTEWLVEDAQMAIDNFSRIKEKALSNQLPSSDGAGMGISRALSEWAPDALYKAGKALEDYYRDFWR